MPTTHKIVSSYTSAYPEPIRLHAGEMVSVAQKDTEWPGWVWCRSVDGREGWVPEKYLRKIGNELETTSARPAAGGSSSGAYIAARDYDATELTVNEGDLVALLYQESGWGWCRNENGRAGWVPLECLEEIS